MSVDRPNSPQTAEVGGVPFTAGANHQQRAETVARPGFSFLDASMSGVARTTMGEILATAKQKITDIAPSIRINPNLSIAVLAVDNVVATNLQLSSIVLAVKPVDSNSKVVAYHTLLLEGSGPALEPKQLTFGAQQVYVDLYPEDVHDPVYARTVQAIVDKSFPNYTVASVSAEIIPRTLNWDDKERVVEMLANALAGPALEVLTRLKAVGELNLSDNARDADLQVLVAYNQGERLNAVGQPTRADMTMKLSAVAKERGDQTTVNNQRRSQELSVSSGFIDLLWVPPEQVMPYGQPQVTQKFSARLVLTTLESWFSMTPGMQLLALVSNLQLAEQYGWFAYFKPNKLGMKSGQVDIRDVGALNIEGNSENEPGPWGTKPETKSATFGDRELGTLLSKLVRPNLSISLDVAVCGPDTWYNEIFSAAASGDQGAAQALINAANELTAGNFGAFYQGGNPCTQFEEVVLNGYYTDHTGAKKDIREIDYLAVMNIAGSQDPTVGAQWSDTILRGDQPLAKRLDARKKMLQHLVGEVTYTGTSRRVTLTAKFLEALVQGIAKCGIGFRMINPGASGEYQSNRGIASFVSESALAATSSGMFNQGYGGASQQGFGRPVMGVGRTGW